MCVFAVCFLLTLPETNFGYTKHFRLRRQHQQQHHPQNQQQNQQPKQQQNFIEFGPPVQIYGVGLSILMVFGHQKMRMIIIMGFLVCVLRCVFC